MEHNPSATGLATTCPILFSFRKDNILSSCCFAALFNAVRTSIGNLCAAPPVFTATPSNPFWIDFAMSSCPSTPDSAIVSWTDPATNKVFPVCEARTEMLASGHSGSAFDNKAASTISPSAICKASSMLVSALVMRAISIILASTASRTRRISIRERASTPVSTMTQSMLDFIAISVAIIRFSDPVSVISAINTGNIPVSFAA